MTTDFRALCATIIATADEREGDGVKNYEAFLEALNVARAALAEPEPPADGEVAELVAWLRKGCQEDNGFQTYSQIQCLLDRAADLLSRQAPQPVPEGPSDEELLEWATDSDDIPPEFLDVNSGRWERAFSSEEFCTAARAVLARWGQP